MVSALDSVSSDPGLRPSRVHCVVFMGKTLYSHSASRLLARILKVRVQIFCGPKAHIAWHHASRGVWGHAHENFEKLKPPRRDFRDSEQL